MRHSLNPCTAVFRVCLLSTLTLVGACSEPAITRPTWFLEDFPDVLDLKQTPSSPDDLTSFSFADMGAWHSFGLPGSGDPEGLGTFTGPFLMTIGGRWLSPSVAKFQIFDEKANRALEDSPVSNRQQHYFPGRLFQYFTAEGLDVTINLLFVTHRSALLHAEVRNVSEMQRRLKFSWSGTLFPGLGAFEIGRRGVEVSFDNGSSFQVRHPAPSLWDISVDTARTAYIAEEKLAVDLAAGQSVSRMVFLSAYFEPAEAAADGEELARLALRPELSFSANRLRWRGYLERVLVDMPERDWNVAVKAVQTLLSNWRSPAGDLKRDGLFPSYAYRGFHGVWSWDSWKHAVALARFEPALAKQQRRVMVDYQNEAGMVADVIYRDASENNWRDTKPPLAAWAVWEIYRQESDLDFLSEMYPRLIRYHRWWYADRDHDRNGICEYGSTDGTRIAAAWESGMDNAIRFDEAEMVRNGERAWSLNQESVDLNSYLFAEKLWLAEMATLLGRGDEAELLRTEAAGLRQFITSRMFDRETGYFYDVRLEDKSPIRVQGPEGWIPLWAGVATPEQARQVREVMLDAERFATEVPFPTVSIAEKGFDPLDGYWRGPVWLDQAYFAVQGLERFGFSEEADRFRRQLLERPNGLFSKGAPIYENYHPLTGQGLNAPHFSWSAAHVILLLMDD